MTRMAWTAEDRRKYAPAIQEGLRQGMIVRLVRTMDALDPQPKVWTSPLGVEGSLTNPITPGGQDGGEADPAPVHGRGQGASGQAAARGGPRPERGRARAGAEPRPAQRVAERAPGGGVGGG